MSLSLSAGKYARDTPAKKSSVSISPITFIPEHHIKRHFLLLSLQLRQSCRQPHCVTQKKLHPFYPGAYAAVEIRSVELAQEGQLTGIGEKRCGVWGHGWGNFCKTIEDPCSVYGRWMTETGTDKKEETREKNCFLELDCKMSRKSWFDGHTIKLYEDMIRIKESI
ncbi:hypothetical protein NXS19_007735 [Fusarium pseudograminearum]|nr:hypothetical protein NXS19_007735 [Fusarium pseudograminearum]